MDARPRYDRDKLVDLLAERATFEKTAVRLYDALLAALVDVDDDNVAASIGDLRRHREEERQHAEWLDGVLHDLGGRPTPGLPAAVSREARALEEVIRGKRNGAGLQPAFHAMLAAELMDAEGWKLLLEIAESVGDTAAARELRTRVAHEDEHLALIRGLVLTLATESVQPHR